MAAIVGAWIGAASDTPTSAAPLASLDRTPATSSSLRAATAPGPDTAARCTAGQPVRSHAPGRAGAPVHAAPAGAPPLVPRCTRSGGIAAEAVLAAARTLAGGGGPPRAPPRAPT